MAMTPGERILSLPLILLLTGIFSIAMFVPALHALVQEDHTIARSFFYSGLLGLTLIFVIGLAMTGQARRDSSDLQNLLSLFLSYTLLPVFLALPFYEGLGTTPYLNAYVAPPLLAGLTDQGMTAGAAMAFMIAGSISSIPAMTAVWSLVRPRVFFTYLGLGVAGAILSGLAFGALI